MNAIIEKVTYKSETSSLISSIIFLIIGAILFTNPNGIIAFLAYILGGIIIVIGVVKIVLSQRNETKSSFDLTFGIIAIVIGLILMLCSSMIDLALRICFGALILLNGISKLRNALEIKAYSNEWIKLLVISLLIIVIGLYIILKSNLLISSIGLVIMIYSVISIIGFILTPKKNKDIVS